MHQGPKTLLEAIQYFSDKQNCLNYLVARRWANGVECPCGSKNVTALKTRQLWQCKNCRKQFSAKVGTIFEDSPLPLTKWMPALWLVMNAKNGVSSYELHRSLGVTQKTAWFMSHRIREAMRRGSIMKFTGTVEVDETYVGGSKKNWSNAKWAASDPNFDHKTPVIALVERGGDAIANVLNDLRDNTIKGEVRANVEGGAVVYTDQSHAYRGLGHEYWHSTVNHSIHQYVRGDVSTNTVEGFFALFKRCIKGTYIHISPFHLNRYLDEQCLRYNTRKGVDGTRFETLVSQVSGRRLTYKQLIGRA